MDSLALSFTSGWASGLNSYLVVLVLGVADRFGHVAQIPDVLGNWWVLGIAAVMYAFEFVADKIPYIDSLWDGVSTLIRPTVGAVIGGLIAGDATGALLGGTSALGAHATKAGTRLAANTLPEPFTNWGLSVGEDAIVLALMSFAVTHPVASAVIALILLAIGLAVLYLAVQAIRAGLAKFRAWSTRRRPVATA